MAIWTCGPNCEAKKNGGSGPCTDSQVTFEGAVLAMRERNGASDSDFFAAVWDAEEGRVREIMYGTTSGWTYHNSAAIDATPEVDTEARTAYTAVLIRTFDAAREDAAKKPAKGAVVRSTTTRGKNKGAVGTVVWIGEDKYRPSYGDRYSRYVPQRVGFKVEGEEDVRYLPDHSVEVVTPAAGPTDEEIRVRAEGLAATSNWQTLMALPAATFGIVTV